MYKVIDANVQRLSDPQEVAKLKALLLEKISDDQRQKSKMANFGKVTAFASRLLKELPK